MAEAILILACFAIVATSVLSIIGVFPQDIATGVIVPIAIVFGGIECFMERGSYLS